MLKFSQPCNPGLRGKGRLRLVDLFSRSQNNHQSIALLEADGDTTISGLDDALHIPHKLGGLHGNLTMNGDQYLYSSLRKLQSILRVECYILICTHPSAISRNVTMRQKNV